MKWTEVSTPRVYTQPERGEQWLSRFQGKRPLFACVLGFTATGLVPGISAAGKTPRDRERTAIADAEFLHSGPQPSPRYPLPPLTAGASPVLISRAILEGQGIPLALFHAGLPLAPAVPSIDLGGQPAACLSTGQAMPLTQAQHLWQQGLEWGERLATGAEVDYLILGECVVGGTSTALAVLLGLGVQAADKVNSSHVVCNHAQKLALVQEGLGRLPRGPLHPLAIAAAVGDPMQVVVAAMAIAASRHGGVLLAGGTQMLAVFALARAIAQAEALAWEPEQIVVGTTRWVIEDPTGDTVGLAAEVGDVPLVATPLSFAQSRYPQLRAYEQGFVKEGVGAGGCAIAAQLYRGWSPEQILQAVDAIAHRHAHLSNPSSENAPA